MQACLSCSDTSYNVAAVAANEKLKSSTFEPLKTRSFDVRCNLNIDVKNIDIESKNLDVSDVEVPSLIEICDTLLKRNKMEQFLKRLITGGEKWIKYENFKRKGSCSKRGEVTQTTANSGFTASKVMLSVWWPYTSLMTRQRLTELG